MSQCLSFNIISKKVSSNFPFRSISLPSLAVRAGALLSSSSIRGSDNKAKPPWRVPFTVEVLLARGLLVMRREMDLSNLYSRLGRSISLN